MAKKWYVIQTYSGFENRVKESLLQRIKEHSKEAIFGEVLIPTETVQETRAGGKQRVKQKTSFPGYIFVEMDMSEDAWHLVKDTPKVTGFIGNQRPQEGGHPRSLSPRSNPHAAKRAGLIHLRHRGRRHHGPRAT